MDKAEQAVQLHQQGCNCCQAVLMSCCEEFGLDREKASRLGAYFGGGMRCGEVCGAVTGGLMTLGLHSGDAHNRQNTCSTAFLKAFQSEFGTLLCREILAKHQKQLCPTLIAWVTKYMEDNCK